MLMNVSALVSLATIENITAHHGIAPVGDEVVLRVALLPAHVQPSAVVPARYATRTTTSSVVKRVNGRLYSTT